MVITENVWTEIGHQWVKLGKIEVGYFYDLLEVSISKNLPPGEKPQFWVLGL